MKYPDRKTAERELLNNGFLPIGRGQFTRTNALACIEKMPTRGVKIRITHT